jgi:ubiquinone/menaquinone biosynthesis C-methylase UbiE
LPKYRKQQLSELADSVIVHNLRKGIPFGDQTVDAVYHSHMLEHIDRNAVAGFLKEVHRVLKPGGIHRVCVPDLEYLVAAYYESLQRCRSGEGVEGHDLFVSDLLEQSVRRESVGLVGQTGFRQFVERKLLGDARARGETHQWMYDAYNLSAILAEADFQNIQRKEWNESSIGDWKEIGLEVSDGGTEYKPHSVYVECTK